MLNQKKVFEELAENGVTYFVGVPDSYLNGFCNYALQQFPEQTVIAANEGNAVGIASGHYIATGELPLVYMQNSGIGAPSSAACAAGGNHARSVRNHEDSLYRTGG